MRKYFSKIVAGLLLVALVFVAVAPHAFADDAVFADVPHDYWAYDAIMEAYKDGAVNGTGNNSSGYPMYSPNDKVTMAQFITILTRAFYGDEVAASNRDTTDCWYNKNYGVAYEHKLFDNVTNWFGDDEVTREAMAQVMYNLMLDEGVVLPNQQELKLAKSRIPDFNSVSTENGDAVAACYYLELITGMDQRGSFVPKGIMNRAQTAVIYTRLKVIMNLMGGVEVQQPTTVPGTTTTPDTNPGTTTTPETNPGTTTTPVENPSQTSGATLTNGMPVTEENVLALIEEYRNGKEPGEKAKAAGFTSYTDGSMYDAYNPKYRIVLPSGPINGIECGKFAYAFFDDVFGADTPIREFSSPADVRPGDLIRFSGHWCVATSSAQEKKYSQGFYYGASSVGGGPTGEIGWGTSTPNIGNAIAFYTRYPE